ncbi:MAG TPA: ABC transporter permease [Candidatus Eisenbacteria bacterium]
MRISPGRVLTIARREYLTTIRRKAFVFTVIGMPALYTFLMFIMIKPQVGEALRTVREFHALGVVDSTGLLAAAPREITTVVDRGPSAFAQGQSGAPLASPPTFHAEVRFYDDAAAAEAALRAHAVDQVLVVPADYLSSGRLLRYARTDNLFSSADQAPVTRWLVRGLLTGRVDSLRIERAARPSRGMALYTLNRAGAFELKDDARELVDFLLPFAFGMLMGLGIVIGGQYLLQGVAEEKESRILESLLCTVTAEDLLIGKLLGLGGAGLTMVGAWILMGSAVATPGAVIAQIHVPAQLVALAVVYYLLGYLFYGSLMTGIGAVTNNMREAQQFAFVFTLMNFIPFYMLTLILSRPDAPLAVALSMFPPMAPVGMLLRLAAPSSAVPAWQIAVSMALLAVSGAVAILAAARVFRVGLLMHGKTPTLPEILRWVREA